MLSAFFTSLASTDVVAAVVAFVTNTWTWGG